MPMPSRSVRPAGNRHWYGGYTAGPATPGRPAMRGTTARCSKVTAPAVVSARSGKSAGACAGTRSSVRRMLTCPASWSEDSHSRARSPGTTRSPAPGTDAPARGLCAPGSAHRWASGPRVAQVTHPSPDCPGPSPAPAPARTPQSWGDRDRGAGKPSAAGQGRRASAPGSAGR
jgi:hypothetical protein